MNLPIQGNGQGCRGRSDQSTLEWLPENLEDQEWVLRHATGLVLSKLSGYEIETNNYASVWKTDGQIPWCNSSLTLSILRLLLWVVENFLVTFEPIVPPSHVYKQKVNIESNYWKGQLCVWKQVAVLCQDQESSKCLPYCCCRAVLLFVLLCVAACIVGMNVWGQVRVFSFWIWGNSDGQIGPMRKWWANWGHYSFDNSNNFKSSNDHSFGGFEKGHTPATFRQLYLFG